MATTLPDMIEVPTSEETVAALLEQGHTAAEIIAEAERNIADAEAGIVWVDAVAGEFAPAVTAAEELHRAAQAALAPFSVKELTEAVTVVDEGLPGRETAAVRALQQNRAAQRNVDIYKRQATLSRQAAVQHRAHAEETIGNARRRIAAAQAVKAVKPAKAKAAK